MRRPKVGSQRFSRTEERRLDLAARRAQTSSSWGRTRILADSDTAPNCWNPGVNRYYRKPTPQTSRPAALFPRCVIRPARPSHMSEREFPHSLLVRRGFRSSYSVVLLSVANFRVADQPPLGGLPRRIWNSDVSTVLDAYGLPLDAAGILLWRMALAIGRLLTRHSDPLKHPIEHKLVQGINGIPVGSS
jgi:hypothetical protein